MGSNEKNLYRVQTGFESSRGVNVAATAKRYFSDVTPRYDRKLAAGGAMSGSFLSRRRPVYARAVVGFGTKEEATFEDFPWTLEHFLKGNVAPVSDAGTPIAYSRTYIPSGSTDDLRSSTWEHNDPGNVYESGQVMGRQLQIVIDPDAEDSNCWMLNAEWDARDWEASTFTAALADRFTEVISASGTRLWLDSSSAIGTTQVVGRHIKSTITLTTGVEFKAFGEDRKYMAVGKTGRGDYFVDAQITYEFDSDTEFAQYRSDAPPLIKARWKAPDGAEIHGSPSVHKSAQIDLYGYWSAWAPSRRKSNTTATLSLMGFVDATSAETVKAIVVNGNAAVV